MNEIRNFPADNRDIVKNMELQYSRDLKTYRIENNNCLLPREYLLIMKILAGVRAIVIGVIVYILNKGKWTKIYWNYHITQKGLSQ